MKKEKTFLFSAFRYVVPADYETWFEKLATKGWHPKKVGQWSSIAMKFKKDKPKKYRYVVDMQAAPKKEYKQTYEEFGWEFVGQMASAFVWRKEYTGERPESFSNIEDLEKRNKRFVGAVAVSFYMSSLITIIVSICFVLNFKSLTSNDYAQFIPGIVIPYAMSIYLGYVIKKIKRNIKR